MNEAKARYILGDSAKSNGELHDNVDEFHGFVSWEPWGSPAAILDGEFTADDLEAIAWWMRENEKN